MTYVIHNGEVLCLRGFVESMLAIPVGKLTGIASNQVPRDPAQSTTAAYQINLPLMFNAPDERIGLMGLYRSTGGRTWVHKDGWNTSSHYCGWYGVTCDENQHVISLILERNNLDGPLPPEIANLVLTWKC